jgi:ABC-type Zn uptake system ZnuABC Zn-binding protein ZnuA
MTIRRITRLAAGLCISLLLGGGSPAAADLDVVTSTTDLGDLVRVVGDDAVNVTVLVKGPQDPHFIEPRPSFIRKLHDADLFVVLGLDLEIGWAPVLVRSARNAAVQLGAHGYLDASTAIEPLEIPTTTVDRSMGDLHAFGNPHYLSDPVNGVLVARLIRDRLATLDPSEAEAFAENTREFETTVAKRLVGEDLAGELGASAVFALAASDRLMPVLAERGLMDRLGGWLGRLHPHRGTPAIQDHRLWPYFAKRFGIDLIETLEPMPGIPPTSRHLAHVVKRAKAAGARGILASPYFDSRHARWVSEKAGIPVVPMAHQSGSREGTDDYLATIDHNVSQWADVL